MDNYGDQLVGQSSACPQGRAGGGLRGVAYRAVASQLSPRRTWRHLVPVNTVLTEATEEGCGLQGSGPGAGDAAADAKEQEAWGGAVPKKKRAPSILANWIVVMFPILYCWT